MSLLTRKARLTGEWDVTSYQSNREYYYNNELFSESKAILNNGVIIYEVDNLSTGVDVIGKEIVHQNSFIFRKDGTWEQVFDMSFLDSNYHFFYTEVIEGEQYHLRSGTWAFEGKSKGEFKNKERLVLSVLVDSSILKNQSFVRDYYNPNEQDDSGPLDDYIRSDKKIEGELVEVYSIIRLSNQELKLQLGEDYTAYTIEEKHFFGDCYQTIWELKKE